MISDDSGKFSFNIYFNFLLLEKLREDYYCTNWKPQMAHSFKKKKTLSFKFNKKLYS